MAARKQDRGDFGLPRRAISRPHVVGIYDLVGFTDLESNDELLNAVRTMQTQLELVFEREEFYWGDIDRHGYEKETNTLLLRSTGDGYVVAFTQGILSDLAALQLLAEVHTKIRNHFDVRLGVNQGENYVVQDLNDRVNIVGWGVNLAARALAVAEKNQIICTQYLAGPLLETHGEVSQSFDDLGIKKVKRTSVHLYNYYKKGEFGSPSKATQRRR